MSDYPRHPAHLDPYIEVLGPELAVRFLIEFGGTPAYFPDDPKGKSAAEALIGPERLRALGARMPSNWAEIPMPRPWLIRALDAEGKSVAAICRLLHTSSTNVKKQLRLAKKAQLSAGAEPQQLRLPF